MPQPSTQQLRDALRAAYDADHAAATIVLARKLLQELPEHAAAWMRLGHALTETANYNEAEHALKMALELCDESRRHIVCAKMGFLFEFQGDYEQAAAWHRQVIALTPGDATGYIFLGCAFARQGKLREAEAAHRSGTECDHGRIEEAYHNLGLVLRAQGKLEEARECFQNALADDPECKEARDGIEDVIEALSHSTRSDV